jgi:hypothetical protein
MTALACLQHAFVVGFEIVQVGAEAVEFDGDVVGRAAGCERNWAKIVPRLAILGE